MLVSVRLFDMNQLVLTTIPGVCLGIEFLTGDDLEDDEIKYSVIVDLLILRIIWIKHQ